MDKKVAIVTGATSGIGLATAELFEKKGYIVYCLARRTIQGKNCISTDITDCQAVKDAINQIVQKEGRIDVLVNNAGMGISGAVEDTSEQSVRKIFDVNFFGSLFVIQAVLPHMRLQHSGSIVNVSSAGAPLSLPYQAFYSASKAAISSLTEALRLEVKPFNIKVSSILPGDVKTDFTSKREKNAVIDSVYSKRIERSVSKMELDEQNGMSAFVIARAIVRLSERKNPPIAKVGGASYAILVCIAKFLPKRAVSFLIGKMYG